MKEKLFILLIFLGIFSYAWVFISKINAVSEEKAVLTAGQHYGDGFEDGYNVGFADAKSNPIPDKDHFPHDPNKRRSK